jgi:hypothetical protein
MAWQLREPACRGRAFGTERKITMSNTIAKENRISRLAAAISCAALVGIGLTPRAAADAFDKKTSFTFSGPVEIPGKALGPSTYVFKLLDSTSNRNIVQIFDKDEKKLYATILAIPDYRLKPAEKPIIMFEERPADTPPAIKAWFYPGDNSGQEFVYPHKQALQLAKRTHQNVLSMKDEMTKNIAAGDKNAKDASVQEMQHTEVMGVNPAGEQVELRLVILELPEK